MQNTFGNTLSEYYVKKFRSNAALRRKRLDAISTPEQFFVYQREIREKIRRAFRLPEEKSPLDPVFCGTLRRDGFRMDKVIYHSRPRLPVTANLYVPDGAQKAPAVLFLCGHSSNGKAADTYQRAILNLVANGFVVLCIDPSGQGERLLLVDVPDSGEFAGYSTFEHNMISKQMQLVDESYTGWCLWDALRGLDYLLEQPEVDPARVSVTGNSGGGNMSAFLTAVDERLFAAAPSCYITTWTHNVENEEPACAEQEPPDLVGFGCEMGDLLLAYAPRPLLVLGQRNDFFDPRGTAETFQEVKRFYDLLGASDKAALFIGPDNHGYHKANRDAMYAFFHRQLGLGAPRPENPDSGLFSDAELQCTPTGQVAHLEGSVGHIDLIRRLADRFKRERKTPPAAEMREKLRLLLKLEASFPAPHYRVLKYRAAACKFFSRFGIETEENMLAVLKYMRPDAINFHFPVDLEEAELYIPHFDSCDEMLEYDFDGRPAFGLDVRGTGETTALSCNLSGGHSQPYDLHGVKDSLYSRYDSLHRQYFASYCCNYHAGACGRMLGEPFVGGRVRDILSTVSLFKGNGTRKLHLVARGQGCVPALFAAVLDERIDTLRLFDGFSSFDSLLRSRITYVPETVIPTGILKLADIPELKKLLGSRLLSD